MRKIAQKKTIPNYHNETIRSRLKDTDWIPMLRGGFLEAYKNFITILEHAMEGCVPNKVKGKKRKNMYISSEAIKMKNLKNKLWRRYKKSGTNYDLLRFRRLKNQLRSLTRRLRLNFENDIA